MLMSQVCAIISAKGDDELICSLALNDICIKYVYHNLRDRPLRTTENTPWADNATLAKAMSHMHPNGILIQKL